MAAVNYGTNRAGVLGTPAVANQVIQEKLIDLVFLGHSALANPHWPIGAARELAHNNPFSVLP